MPSAPRHMPTASKTPSHTRSSRPQDGSRPATWPAPPGGCGKKAPPVTPQAAVEVKVITAEASPTVMYADKVGEVKGSQEVDIRSMVSGILLKKHFDDGTRVAKG